MATNILDRLIGAIAPRTGLRRMRDRALLERAYEGASLKDGWKPRRAGASANSDHRVDATILRARARSLVQNTPYISRGLTSLTSNVIGTGITPRSMAKDETARTRISTLYAQWVRVADADGRQNFYGLQATAYRAMKQDGEVLIRLRPRMAQDGLPIPLQLQILEIDWLDSYRNGSEGSNTVINGIEYDPIGRVVAYWLFEQHPGEVNVLARTGNISKRIPAESIIHLYKTERPGQGRGITSLASVIARVRDLANYEDAELARKNLETRLSVIASGDVSMLDNGPPNGTGPNPDNARITGSLGELPSGGITQVDPGIGLTVVEPKAAPGYVEYVKYALHLIAAGFGPTYEMMTGDVSETNFSSARVRLLDFRRECEQEQWLTFIPQFLERVWVALIDAATLAGKIKTADYTVDWSTPKWDYVNPEQDVKADMAEISAGLSSISEKLRRRGYDPELVFSEIKSDFDRLGSDGTLDILAFLQRGQRMSESVMPPA